MPAELLVGTLNCLGDAFNPFEFLSEDAAFRASCDKLHAAADALDWDNFSKGCGNIDIKAATSRLQAHCHKGGTVWSFFDEPTLLNDNKIVEPRLNLLIFAMRRCGPDGKLTWQLLPRWQAAMRQLIEDGSAAYAADPNLLAWDCACNVVAALEPDAYRSVCSASHLNPNNFVAMARTYLDAALRAADGRPLVLGLQEWPRSDTPKARAFSDALEERGLAVVCSSRREAGEGVAVVYAKELGAAEVLADSSEVDVMRGCLDAAARAGEELDRKAADVLLGTTARKVLRVRLPAVAATTFVVVHAKEPKTAAAARVLAQFIREMGTAGTASSAFVALVDTNTDSRSVASAFTEALACHDLDALPAASVATTAKQRSRLHGQCYDTHKCFQLVVASKDKLVAPRGSLSRVTVHPDLSREGASLPSPVWGSDHALTTAVFAPIQANPISVCLEGLWKQLMSSRSAGTGMDIFGPMDANWAHEVSAGQRSGCQLQ